VVFQESDIAFSKKTVSLTALVVICGLWTAAFAQQRVIPVWPGAAPGSETWTQKEVEYTNPLTQEKMVRNVVRPTLTVYLPDRSNANGTAVVVCPGGGFLFLSWQSEGTDVAKWLAARGVAAFVLKYRLTPSPASEQDFQKTVAALFTTLDRSRGVVNPESMIRQVDPLNIRSLAIADGRQALGVVRQRGSEWGIRSNRIGLMGFSAGAITTMGVVMEHDGQSRPNFAAPIYGGSVDGRPIPADAPPLFVLVANDDPWMSFASVKLYSDWHAAGLPAELHVFSQGGHGFGMTKHGLPVDHWIDLFGEWLEVQGWLKPAP
jgi:acetyl esterase/lipase